MCIRGIPAIWDVDGQLFEEEPPINVASVLDVYVLKGRTARYGGKSAIVVKTTSNVLGLAEKLMLNGLSNTWQESPLRHTS